MEKPVDTFQPIIKTLIRVGIGLLVLLMIIAFNNVIQISSFMSGIHPLLGQITLVVLLLVFLALLLLPLISFLSFRKALPIPEDENSPEFANYLNETKRRLQKNRYLREKDYQFSDGSDLKNQIIQAYEILGKRSRELIKGKATGVFLSTSISQNGVLDSFFVLGTLTKMLWEVSRIYEERPSIARLVSLYGNVAATVLMARGIEDLDLLDEQVEPLIASILGGGMATLVPGAVMATNLVVNSITEGSVNALLTLRVGCIAQGYLSSVTIPERKALRRSATIEACGMLGEVMKENSVLILKAFAKGARNAAKNTFKL
ncbi:DUF697 domain-containing protein [Gudongella oleilytica]|uniref:DUF697 domain-containing protein n=1 Tax=Gudongella oleilytica TaxID=1582259 RepID=UPI000FF8879E|nr:DUF697 domain-containing protein [Gudongella oleilytica]